MITLFLFTPTSSGLSVHVKWGKGCYSRVLYPSMRVPSMPNRNFGSEAI